MDMSLRGSCQKWYNNVMIWLPSTVRIKAL